MSEKRVYQEKMLNSKKEIVVCNWERGEGKTYSIFKNILRCSDGKCLYISNNNTGIRKYLKDHIEQRKIRSLGFKKITDTESRTTIIENENYGIDILYSRLDSLNEYRGIKDIMYVFFDEYFPNSNELSIIKSMGVKQIFIMVTNGNVEYIDSRRLIQIDNFYNKQIEELMIEYAEIDKNKNTTMTRENILKQIKILQDMERGN